MANDPFGAARTIDTAIGKLKVYALDALSDAGDLGKPVGQDEANHRPNAIRALGEAGAMARLETLALAAVDAVPVCPGRSEIIALINHTVERLLPDRAAAVG